MYHSLTVKNNFFNNVASVGKFVAKSTATGTVVIPLFIGMRDLYKGYNINISNYKNVYENKRFHRYSNSENSRLRKILRCANLILALKVGCDTLWSSTSYKRLSNDPIQELKKISPETLSKHKLYFLLDRPDFVHSLNSEEIEQYFTLAKISQHEYLPLLNTNQLSKYAKKIMENSDKIQIEEFINDVISIKISNDNCAAMYNSLSPKQKRDFVSALVEAKTNNFWYGDREVENFIRSIDLNDVDVLKLSRKSAAVKCLLDSQVRTYLSKNNKAFTELPVEERREIIKNLIHSLSNKEIIEYQIYKHKDLLDKLLLTQTKRLLTSNDGTGLTPEIFQLLDDRHLSYINISQVRFTRESNGSFDTIHMNEWLNDLKKTSEGYKLFKKFSRPDVHNFYNLIQGADNKQAFKNNIKKTLGFDCRYRFGYRNSGNGFNNRNRFNASDYSYGFNNGNGFNGFNFGYGFNNRNGFNGFNFGYGFNNGNGFNGFNYGNRYNNFNYGNRFNDFNYGNRFNDFNYGNGFNDFNFNEDFVSEKEAREAARRLGITDDILGDWKPFKEAYRKLVLEYKDVRQNIDGDKTREEELKQIQDNFDLIKKYRELNGLKNAVERPS